MVSARAEIMWKIAKAKRNDYKEIRLMLHISLEVGCSLCFTAVLPTIIHSHINNIKENLHIPMQKYLARNSIILKMKNKYIEGGNT